MNHPVENPSRRRLFRGKLSQPAPSLRLPWIKSEAHFLSNCTQCGDCLTACETNIITQDDTGFPKVDFTKDECTFCGKCQTSCQQPLFISKDEITAANILPWPATLTIANQCLAQNDIFCQSCQDACEPKAITFDFASSSIPKPSVNLTNCNQCGACVSTCPQQAIALTPQLAPQQQEVNHA